MRKHRQNPALLDFKIPFSVGEKIMVGGSLLFVLGIFIATLAVFPKIPTQVPIGFDFSGDPQGLSGRNSLFILPSMALILCLFLGLMSRYPKLYNYRFRLTPENAQQQYLLSRQLLLSTNLVIALMMAYIQSCSLLMALGIIQGLNSLILIFFMALLFGLLLIYLKKARTLRAAAEEIPNKKGKGQ